jgi:hypothetical protein
MPAESVEDYTVDLLARGHYDGLVVECNGFQELIADNVIRKCQQRGVRCPLFKRTSTENKEVRIRLGLGPPLAQGRVRLCSAEPELPAGPGAAAGVPHGGARRLPRQFDPLPGPDRLPPGRTQRAGRRRHRLRRLSAV